MTWHGTLCDSFPRIQNIIGHFSLADHLTYDPLLRSKREIIVHLVQLINYEHDLKVSVAALRVFISLSNCFDQSFEAFQVPNKLFVLLESMGKSELLMQSVLSRLESEDDGFDDECLLTAPILENGQLESIASCMNLTSVIRILILDYFLQNVPKRDYNPAHFLLGISRDFASIGSDSHSCLVSLLNVFDYSLLNESGVIYTKHPLFATKFWHLLSILCNDVRFRSGAVSALQKFHPGFNSRHISFLFQPSFEDLRFLGLRVFSIEASTLSIFPIGPPPCLTVRDESLFEASFQSLVYLLGQLSQDSCLQQAAGPFYRSIFSSLEILLLSGPASFPFDTYARIERLIFSIFQNAGNVLTVALKNTCLLLLSFCAAKLVDGGLSSMADTPNTLQAFGDFTKDLDAFERFVKYFFTKNAFAQQKDLFTWLSACSLPFDFQRAFIKYAAVGIFNGSQESMLLKEDGEGLQIAALLTDYFFRILDKGIFQMYKIGACLKEFSLLTSLACSSLFVNRPPVASQLVSALSFLATGCRRHY